ncbi:hypothetical protein [Geitlerinema sp. PCC 9228]|nr:hypothetical protein [Geitlerinema sp. PCC 9228]
MIPHLSDRSSKGIIPQAILWEYLKQTSSSQDVDTGNAAYENVGWS